MAAVASAVLLAAALVGADFSDQFAVQLGGGRTAAERVARRHGLVLLDKIFDDVYHFRHHRVAKRSPQPARDFHRSLQADPEVKWFQQQRVKRRSKRGWHSISVTTPHRRRGRGREHESCSFNDPRWPQMWYLNRGQGVDMNVEAVWSQGLTGKGVVVTILDDGLEKDHPDIYSNYDPEASYDVNGHDPDPQPRYDLIDSNRHGTRCAGEVSSSANNSICGLGVAYEASIGGVRMLDGDVTDAVEARSLSLNPHHVDIYSASWGPDDDGKTVDGPGILATRAFMEGVEKGRNGLGSIYVWASGNGGREHDNCNCDGYTNSIWTLSISSATEFGSIPWYSEACSSTVASTYSSGSAQEKQITTTDLHHGCTSGHTGTSASAPLAAGLCALTLEANKKLTWRDLQHIVVRTSRSNNLRSKDWRTNGAGRNVSHVFGFGLMDAGAMVEMAKVWNTAPPQKVCEIRAYHVDKVVPAKSRVDLSLDVNCENVQFLEHVQAKISITATRRGDLHIYLTSPMGTRSTLLAQRPLDSSRSGFQGWPFMTVHNWGENPNGLWKLEVHNEGRFYGRAALREWILVLYGTTEDPDTYRGGPSEAPRPPLPPVPLPPRAPKTLARKHEATMVQSSESPLPPTESSTVPRRSPRALATAAATVLLLQSQWPNKFTACCCCT